ncbi:MAG: IS1634 family transposase [Planctomycetes bacterium]|nr:IS1634 family transposase [Planctomycetota bacterium]
MGLRELLNRHVRAHGNDQIPVVDTLMLLVYNLVLGKDPLYELQQWVAGIDRRAIGYRSLEPEKFNDDRFARALDRLYMADRASLMTEFVTTLVREFKLDLGRIHNDSTTVKAYGKYPGSARGGLQLKRGHSKDHRPDLKQLVFSLSISADGAVPVHHKVYAGNRTDDSTHIETWETVRKIAPKADFLYVADSKLCTDEQLHTIDKRGGRAVTIMPETWGEVAAFKAGLKATRKAKKEIWRRPKPGADEQSEYFSVFAGDYTTRKRGYRIHWIYSSEKRKRDRLNREKRLVKAEQALMELNAKLNTRKLKLKENIEAGVAEIADKYKVADLLAVQIGASREQYRVKVGKGRPGKHARYETRARTIHTLTWGRNNPALKAESKLDGIFPLLSTDTKLTAKEVLQAYKYQPRLEKRFCQFKSIHNAAPLLFKKVTRVEANMFLFFIALTIQALIEREIRSKMTAEGRAALNVYPEERDAVHPTTNKIFDRVGNLSTYSIIENEYTVEEYKDELTETQGLILDYLDIPEKEYWCSIS